ncbi:MULTISPECIES: helix-turn-helix transcriptional regulator [unclassified Pseudoalteromonas]|uniref:helix-turn-helix transcriptional regulator n=1 Tax=unclassified Pseudoalteromonas TaxID=194690 RepID=UPI002097E12C|nr:helix-turn-helix transcriptional regulator [Pseudoalteromonas sp. XMcav2-N]MCO7189623.1 helix-turn-helix domain-containing protein [Pseudoalteromonas sp. XMcav2-N]
MRLLAGKTQQQMADLVGISRDTYINYEKEVSKIPLEYFIVWSKACKIDFTSIFRQLTDCKFSVEAKGILRARQRTKGIDNEEKS